MSEVKDYGEPWVKVSGRQPDGDTGEYYCWEAIRTSTGENFCHDADEDEGKLDRIVACVNAFAGLDPAKSVVIDIEDARELEDMASDIAGDCEIRRAVLARLREAIAKKEGV